jgi:putative DNA methylase
MMGQQLVLAGFETTEQPPAAKPIEVSFPLAEISLLAQRESWRKEIFRPLYHIHKWWANRLGSVFRAIVLGAIGDPGQDIWGDFYKEHDFTGKIVLDPFMGSGTTLGEAVKLGARSIGCDVNPISTFAVTQALTRVDIQELERTFAAIEADVRDDISGYYTTRDPETNETIPVLYYFWVKVVETPSGEIIPLFSEYVFSKNAYPKRKPQSQILCPHCWRINVDRYDAEVLTCVHCDHTYNPQKGPVDGRYVTDRIGNRYEIKALLPKDGTPPKHRLYALMALRANEEKIYLAAQPYDLELMERAREALKHTSLPLPTMPVRPGNNTDQARNYQYRHWRDFFNERQLLCLGLLLRRILQIPNRAVRDQFLCLFSTTLEFNNLFCSFKGEGTGAVRHMFSHHILKPERAPLENNVWGTPQSSGSFSRLFKSKLLKAKRYLDQPFELRLNDEEDDAKATNHTASRPINVCVTHSWEAFSARTSSALVLNGDSAALPIPDKVVDAVVTDPPYFDFIHYSELSDFFFAWLAPVLGDEYPYFKRSSSHHEGEVQNKQPDAFAANLARVFRESRRVLKDDGLLVFSFHHSRSDGWTAIYRALQDAGFHVVAAYPVYAEMRGASPKSGTKEPISIDIILVCRKSGIVGSSYPRPNDYAEALSRAGIALSVTDDFNVHAGWTLIEAAHRQLSLVELKQRLERLKEMGS